VIWIDLDLCISCAICASVCPLGALSISFIEEQKEYSPRVLKERRVSVDSAKCNGCSECVKECPSQAILCGILLKEHENR
jgi:formate hydrogenlyase subunit 6/NADH:ubiquinone oxidoreductase subunit I